MKTKNLSKTAIYNNVIADIEDFLKGTKIGVETRKDLMAILDDHLKPKAGGGTSEHPPKLDKDGNIIEAYCRYHEKYYPAEDMVISNGKSKGYSKAAIAVWNKAQREIKKMQEEVTTLIEADKFEEAKKLSNDISILKIECLQPSYYVAAAKEA